VDHRLGMCEGKSETSVDAQTFQTLRGPTLEMTRELAAAVDQLLPQHGSLPGALRRRRWQR
jgi:hypothetical protein